MKVAALIRTPIERARAAGLTRIELTVREGNDRAIALYHGLHVVEENFPRHAAEVAKRRLQGLSSG